MTVTCGHVGEIRFQMHYREPPAAQIADTKHEVASRGNELRMTSTCVHVVYRQLAWAVN